MGVFFDVLWNQEFVLATVSNCFIPIDLTQFKTQVETSRFFNEMANDQQENQ